MSIICIATYACILCDILVSWLSRNMVIMLIGNKCDLERREVSFEEGAWFARQLLVLQPGRVVHGCDPTGESLLRVVSLR